MGEIPSCSSKKDNWKSCMLRKQRLETSWASWNTTWTPVSRVICFFAIWVSFASKRKQTVYASVIYMQYRLWAMNLSESINLQGPVIGNSSWWGMQNLSAGLKTQGSRMLNVEQHHAKELEAKQHEAFLTANGFTCQLQDMAASNERIKAELIVSASWLSQGLTFFGSTYQEISLYIFCQEASHSSTYGFQSLSRNESICCSEPTCLHSLHPKIDCQNCCRLKFVRKVSVQMSWSGSVRHLKWCAIKRLLLFNRSSIVLESEAEQAYLCSIQ